MSEGSQTRVVTMDISVASRSVTRIATALVAALALFAFGAAPASAHDVLIDTSPQDGAELTTTTDTIVLTFSNTVTEIGGKIRVAPADGEAVDGDLTADGKNAVYTFEEPLANGEYTVSWRVVSSDSHPIEGTFEFTVNDPDNVPSTEPIENPDPTDSVSTSAGSGDAANADDAAALNNTDTASTDAAQDPDSEAETPESSSTLETSDSDDSGSSINWSRIGIAALLGALAGVVLVIFNKKRKKND